MRVKYFRAFLLTSLAAFLLPIICPAQTPGATNEKYGLPAQYSATAFGQAGSAAGKSFGLTIYVTDLTDDATTQTLAATRRVHDVDRGIYRYELADDANHSAFTCVPGGAAGGP